MTESHLDARDLDEPPWVPPPIPTDDEVRAIMHQYDPHHPISFLCKIALGFYDGAEAAARRNLPTALAHARSREGLSHDQIKIACKNVGVDLDCGACELMFYTGHGDRVGPHTCPGERADVVAIVEATTGDASRDDLIRLLTSKPLADVPRARDV